PAPARTAPATWPPPLDPDRRREIPAPVVQEFREAQGEVHPEFAFCLELPRARFASICHELAQGGYRPVQMLIYSRSGALVVTAIWHRDGLPWLLREDISPAEALEEDRRQRAAGLESVGIDFRVRDRVTVLWSAGVVWGRPRRRPFGSNPELRLVNDQRFTGRWRSRYYQLPQWPVDGRPNTALLERSTPVLELTANSLLEGHSRLWAQLRPGEAGHDPVFSEPRHVVLVADTEFHSPAGEFLLQGTAVHGLRVELDGVALDLGDLGGDGFHPALAQTVTLTEGHHTLRAVFHWRQLDRRTSLGLGAPRIEWPVVDSRPDWLFDTNGSSDLEQSASIRRAEFDVEILTLTADLHGTQAMADLLRQGFRPYHITFAKDFGLETRITFARPAPQPVAVEKQAQRRARAVLGLLELDDPARAWPEAAVPWLKARPATHDATHDATLSDPTVQAELTGHLASHPLSAFTPWSLLAPDRALTSDPEIRQQLWLALGRLGLRLAARDRARWVEQLDIPGQWATDPDAGVHGALDWLLRAWQIPLPPLAAGSGSATPGSPVRPPDPQARATWWVNSQGQVFTLFPATTFLMGDRHPNRVLSGQGNVRHWETVPRPFALASTKVTYPQYGQFHSAILGQGHTVPLPVSITWIEAGLYLNLLSEQEGLTPCYDVTPHGTVVIPPDALDRSGYRFPPSAEWEAAARAGIGTDWPSGLSPSNLRDFAWTAEEFVGRLTAPVGQKFPNHAGLFDVLGIGPEWLHDRLVRPEETRPIPEVAVTIQLQDRFLTRSGSMQLPGNHVRLADRSSATVNAWSGLRPARTLGAPPGPPSPQRGD
ncbi:MAG: formylglycine-generating enzyme family protein, partial [Planctomycetaceae bacterium]